TSRIRLNNAREWVMEVHGLPFPADSGSSNPERFPAVSLFIQRAHQSSSDFVMNPDDLQWVVRICQLVDGMPLAIELAATWVRVLSCRDIAVEVERNLDFLATTAQDIPRRHRSIRAVFDQSWGMLNAEEKRVMTRLSVFRGGIDLDAARHVAGATLPILVELVSKSLVRKAANHRFDLHELIRQYAQEQLNATEALHETADAHLMYFVTFAETVEPRLRGSEQLQWLDRLEQDHDNLRAALACALTNDQAQPSKVTLALRLACALYLFWRRRGYWSEGRDWLNRAVAQAVALPLTRERLRAVNASVRLAAEQADTAQALELARQNLCDARQQSDASMVALSLNTLGFLMWKKKELRVARSYSEESLRLYRELGERLSIADSLHNLGHICINQAEYDAAQSFNKEAATIYWESGDNIGHADVLGDLGLIAYLRDDFETAHALQMVSLARLREVGSVPGTVAALSRLGDLARTQADYKQAGALYTEGLSLYRNMGDKDELPSLLHNQAYVALHSGNYAEALSLFKEALAVHQETANLGGIAECVAGIAAVLARQSHFVQSFRLFSASETIRSTIGAEIWPADREEHRKTLAILRDSLDDVQMTEIQAEGAALASSGFKAVVAAAMALISGSTLTGLQVY
ncbi:MAG TPA: tetratricopeptide repeat protein, partial [Anaerolineae bacterium]